MGQARSPKRRVRDEDFILGLSSECCWIVFIFAKAIQGFSAEILNLKFHERRNICGDVGGWLLLLGALYWTFHAWCTGRFTWHKDQPWIIFRGRRNLYFGDVGLVLFVAGATCREILRDTRTTKRCTVPYRTRLRNGTGKVSEAAGARWRFLILGISSECRRIVFILPEAIHGFFGQILNSKFRGRRNIWWCGWLLLLRVLYRNFMCDKDQSSESFFVAGPVFGEAGRQLMVALRVALDVSLTNPTSPYVAPATTKGSGVWSLCHMKRPVQCAQHQDSSSNSTKYCTCHEIWSSRFQRQIPELCIATSSTVV